jgi:hypothetical protein
MAGIYSDHAFSCSFLLSLFSIAPRRGAEQGEVCEIRYAGGRLDSQASSLGYLLTPFQGSMRASGCGQR